jgi:uncharacterized protein YndB with AHSA1/START domain
MIRFEERAVCQAPPEEVWKLLYDPARFAEWWETTASVDASGDGPDVVRYTDTEPGVAWPTSVRARRDEGRVVISCILTDIVWQWTLEPATEGCAVALRVGIPDREKERLDAQRRIMARSIARLVAVAEREAAAPA